MNWLSSEIRIPYISCWHVWHYVHKIMNWKTFNGKFIHFIISSESGVQCETHCSKSWKSFIFIYSYLQRLASQKKKKNCKPSKYWLEHRNTHILTSNGNGMQLEKHFSEVSIVWYKILFNIDFLWTSRTWRA